MSGFISLWHTCPEHSAMPKRCFPPGVHRLGGLNAAPVNRQLADEFCREVAPVALELRRAGLSLRAIGQELARRGIAPRNGSKGQTWSASSVRRLLDRAKLLAAAHVLERLYRGLVAGADRPADPQAAAPGAEAPKPREDVGGNQNDPGTFALLLGRFPGW
jgi:hypothetical protein